MSKSTAYILYLAIVGMVGFVLGTKGFNFTDGLFWVVILGLFLSKELGGHMNGKN